MILPFKNNWIKFQKFKCTKVLAHNRENCLIRGALDRTTITYLLERKPKLDIFVIHTSTSTTLSKMLSNVQL